MRSGRSPLRGIRDDERRPVVLDRASVLTMLE